MHLRQLIVLLLLLLPFLKLKAQNENAIDSLTLELTKATTPEDKFTLYKELAYLEEPKSKYRNRMLLNAELSGNTELQLKTYLFVASLQQDSAQFYVDKMFALAKEKKNEEYQGWYYLYSGGHEFFEKNNTAKALDLVREANTIAVTNHLDSLAYEVNRFMGAIHNNKGEKLLEYKSYMVQLSLAEKIGDGQIAIGTYWDMFWFYSTLKHYSKAKEYALKILEKGKKENWPPWIEGGNHLLTHHYTNVGEFETAKYYYEETNKLRKQNNTPVGEDDDLLDIYTMAKDYEKMLRMLQKDEIKKNYQKGNLNSALYDYYGEIANCYTKLGMADSALLSLQKMKEAIRPNEANNWRYFAFLGNYYKLINKADSAAVYYAKADSGIGYTNTIDAHIERYANLDTLFTRNGNYEKAYYYKTLWMQYKDSAAALSEEGDLVVMEIESENQRMEAERRASHNIQYMGITAGLAAVFILLVLLGVFSSSTAVIRGLGFFAFIFFFEFLILLFDTAIHALTHGEPWKILSIKIVLIAMLLPFHHYAEHKVVDHLLHRKKFNLFNWRKAKQQRPAPVEDSVEQSTTL
jgi:tetratricopeptide (TPR) repeat protein